MDKVTDVWKLYEEGKDFLDQLDLVNKTTQAYRFYEGDHWHGLDSGGEKMPIVEIIKPVIDYKTTILTQNRLQATYTSQDYDASPDEAAAINETCDRLGEQFLRYWEHSKMDSVLYDVVKDALIAGDSYMYLYHNPSKTKRNGVEVDGVIESEIIKNTNIMFADENERDIQKQQHILVLFRRTVKSVKEEAKLNGISEEDIRRIVPDDDRDQQTGYTEEVRNKSKCLCIMKMWKESGTVHITKTTKNVVYQKDTDLTITEYPIASYVWEPKQGLCRGVSDVTKYIPNQIWVNRLEAYRLISAKMAAFPKLVYSGNLVNKDDIDCVGVALEVQDNDISKALESVGYINPAPMSNDAKAVLDELMTYTKDAAGASDLATGRDKLDNYAALMAIQQSASAPLQRQTERLKTMIEDIARIIHDFWCTYYVNGLHYIGEDKMPGVIPYEVLSSMKVDIRIDVTPTSPFNKLTEQQKIDNLLVAQQISFDEYVELLQDDEPLKPKLEMIIEKRQMLMMQQAQQQQLIAEQAAALDQAATENIEQRSALMQAEEERRYAQMEGYTEAAINSAAAKEE